MLTLQGILLLFLDLFLYFLAFFTSNLGFLILATLFLTLFGLSYLIARWTLNGLTPIRKIPRSVVRFSPALFSIGLQNQHRTFAVYSIKIKDVIDGEVVDKPCYFFKVPPCSSLSTFYRHAFVNRGEVSFDGIKVSTSFPFSLLKMSRFFPLMERTRVLPESLLPQGGLSLRANTPLTERDYHLKPFRLGDHPRFIHWPQSMRRGQLLTRGERRDSIQPVWVKIENRLTPHPKGGYIRSQDSFELTVSHAAGLAYTLLRRGVEVGILARGSTLSPVAGEENMAAILDFLATLGHYEGPYVALPPKSLVLPVAPEGHQEVSRDAL